MNGSLPSQGFQHWKPLAIGLMATTVALGVIVLLPVFGINIIPTNINIGQSSTPQASREVVSQNQHGTSVNEYGEPNPEFTQPKLHIPRAAPILDYRSPKFF